MIGYGLVTAEEIARNLTQISYPGTHAFNTLRVMRYPDRDPETGRR